MTRHLLWISLLLCLCRVSVQAQSYPLLLNGEELIPESERAFQIFLYSGTLEHGKNYQLSNGIKTISVTAR